MTTADAAPRRTPLRALTIAYLISETGTAVSMVAIPWLVLATTGSASATGVVGFAQMTPYVVFQAIAGPVIDRIGLRRTFLLGNAVAGVAMCLIPLLQLTGALNLGLLIVFAVVAGGARGMADSSTTPMIPLLAAAAHTANERAVGLYSAASRTAMLLGMPLAGILIAWTGAASAVLVDGLSFFAGAAVAAALVPKRLTVSTHPAPPIRLRVYLGELGEGLRFLRADRLLLGLVLMIVVMNFVDEALTGVFLPVWAHNVVHSSEALGLVGAISGGAMLVGVLLTTCLGRRLPRWATFAVSTFVAAWPPFLVIALTHSVLPVAIAFAVCGIFGGVPNPIIGAVQFERVPEHLRTRVLGAMKASAWVGIPFGSLLGGLLTEAAGLTTAMIVAACLMALATVSPLVFPVWRGLNDRPDTSGRPAPAV